MTLTGIEFAAGGATLPISIATRITAGLGGSVVARPGETSSFAGISESAFGDLPLGQGLNANVHAVHAVGGAFHAQWSYDPGPVLLTTPYAEVALGVALPMLALARRMGLWSRDSVSALEALFVLQSGAYSHGAERPPDRWGESPRGQHPTYALYECRDGWVFMGALSLTLALKALTALDLLAEFGGEVLAGLFDKQSPHRAETWEILGRRFATLETTEAVTLLGTAGVPVSVARTPAEAMTTPLWNQLEQEPLVAVTPRPAPAPSSSETNRPLRVLEIAGYISGPFTARLLCDFGTEVTKVEPLDGDPLRRQSLSFAAWNHGKTIVTADLNAAEDAARVRALIAEADIIVTNYLPRVLAKLGLGLERLFELNPRAIIATIGGFPAGSGLDNAAAFDPAIQAIFGIMRRQGGQGEPVKPQIAASDYISAMLATTGILAALDHRKRQGGEHGYHVTTSLTAAGYLLASGGQSMGLTGGRDFKGNPNDAAPAIYRCADGWLAASDATGSALTRSDCEAHLAGILTEAGIEWLHASGIEAVPCLHPDTLDTHPAFQAANLFHVVEDETGRPVTTPRIFGAVPRSITTGSLRGGL